MRILLTGASSFTGFWFARELAEAGHAVTATFTRLDTGSYAEGVRARRVAEALRFVEPVFGVWFGDDKFMGLVEETPFDAICVHGADVTDYKSPDFDVCRAVASNTRCAAKLFSTVADSSCQVVLTGSVFEGGEGAGSEGVPHFSPYGLSKAITHQVFDFYAAREGVRLRKFVIPNPFGPFEEPRFTAYLMRTWMAGDCAQVRTPRYVRDNIHVSLLAAAYERFVSGGKRGFSGDKLNPSGYVESQGAFAQRFAKEVGGRLGLACDLEIGDQTEFSEPLTRINTDPMDATALDWDERLAWDEVADYYRA